MEDLQADNVKKENDKKNNFINNEILSRIIYFLLLWSPSTEAVFFLFFLSRVDRLIFFFLWPIVTDSWKRKERQPVENRRSRIRAFDTISLSIILRSFDPVFMWAHIKERERAHRQDLKSRIINWLIVMHGFLSMNGRVINWRSKWSPSSDPAS